VETKKHERGQIEKRGERRKHRQKKTPLPAQQRGQNYTSMRGRNVVAPPTGTVVKKQSKRRALRHDAAGKKKRKERAVLTTNEANTNVSQLPSRGFGVSWNGGVKTNKQLSRRSPAVGCRLSPHAHKFTASNFTHAASSLMAFEKAVRPQVSFSQSRTTTQAVYAAQLTQTSSRLR
jgi:hypothetical protein